MSGTESKFMRTETDFTRFVRAFRGSIIVHDLIPDVPVMEANADYYFSSADVIAELKCLCTDTGKGELLYKRFLSVCRCLGYSAEQALKIALREAPLPRKVAQAVIGKSLDHVRRALQKANHQISVTRRQLGRASAWDWWSFQTKILLPCHLNSSSISYPEN